MHIRSFEQSFGLGVVFVSAFSTVAAVPFETAKVQVRAPDPASTSTASNPAPPPGVTSVASAATRAASDHRKPPPSSVTVNRAAMTPYLYGCDKNQ
jgi:hypothetical protein